MSTSRLIILHQSKLLRNIHSSQAGVSTDLGVLVVQLALQAIDKHGVGQGLRQQLFKLCQVLCWQGAQHKRPPWLQPHKLSVSVTLQKTLLQHGQHAC